MGSIKDSNLGQAWLVLLLSIVFSVSLAAVHLNLSPMIEENITKQTMENIPFLITGNNADTFDIKKRIIDVNKNGITKSYTVYDALDNSGNIAGHVVKSSGQGYADKIALLMGLDPDGKKITGLFILEQKETPGLGNKIIEDTWRDQFKDKSTTDSIVVIKGNSVNDNEIDAVSGATISSRAVTDIVNSAIADIKTEIALAPSSNNKMENK